jgi:hypothetical protein
MVVPAPHLRLLLLTHALLGLAHGPLIAGIVPAETETEPETETETETETEIAIAIVVVTETETEIEIETGIETEKDETKAATATMIAAEVVRPVEASTTILRAPRNEHVMKQVSMKLHCYTKSKGPRNARKSRTPTTTIITTTAHCRRRFGLVQSKECLCTSRCFY